MTRFAIFVFALFLCVTMSELNAQDNLGISDTVWVKSGLGDISTVNYFGNDEFVVVLAGGGIYVLNASDGSVKWSSFISPAGVIALSKDENTFYTCHLDRKIRKWSINSNQVLEEIDYSKFLKNEIINGMYLNSDERKLIAIYYDVAYPNKVANLFEIDLETKIFKEMHQNPSTYLKFNMDDTRNIIAITPSVTVQEHTSITLLSYPSFEKIANLGSANTGGVMDMEFSADGKFIACGTDKGYVIVWDLETKSIIKKLLDPLDPVRLNSIVCYPDFSFIVAGNNGGRVWDIQNEKIVDRFWGYGLARDMILSKDKNNLLLAATSKLVNFRTNWIVNVPLGNSTEIIYPNPSNGNVLIEFQSSKTENCEIKIVNEMGITTQNLHNGLLLEGMHRFEWNSLPFPNGLYFCTFTSPSYQKSFKIMINK